MTTNTSTAASLRTDKLIIARQEASRIKTVRALETVARLHAAGDPVTFARVARTANVSTWFTYNNTKVAAAVREAQADQTEHGLREAPHPGDRVSAASLRVDLAHARQEIRDLRGRVRQLEQAVGRRLGSNLELVDSTALLNQLENLGRHNRDLAQQVATSERQRREIANDLASTEADLAAARETLRRAIRPVPTSS